jgi:hypothetical protein
MAADPSPGMQSCPFCYTELDARATVCSHCHAEKEPAPGWFGRFKLIAIGLIMAAFGYDTMFPGLSRTPNMWGVPFFVLTAICFWMAWRLNFSERLWRRKA